MEGVKIDKMSAGHMRTTITPDGQMTNMVKNASWRDDQACYDIASEDGVDKANACRYTNYTFLGAPSGKGSTVTCKRPRLSAHTAISSPCLCHLALPLPPRSCWARADAFEYYNVDRLGSCDNAGELTEVFYEGRELRPHLSHRRAPKYCISTSLESLEAGSLYRKYAQAGKSSYNFASLCTRACFERTHLNR